MSNSESDLNRKLVSLYLKHGSVEQVFSKYDGQLPVSYPEYHRVLNRFGIVKSAGRNSCRMAEVISFFEKMVKENQPLKKTYHRMPYNFQTSLGTLYRIYWNMKKGLAKRFATALVITPYNSPELILVGSDVSTPRIELGKRYGSVTIPTTFSDKKDSKKEAIKRVLQQEVFTNKFVTKNKLDIDFDSFKLFAYIDIVDVRVTVYHVQLAKQLNAVENFSSYKLQNQRYLNIVDLTSDQSDLNLRQGILEIIKSYQEYIANKKSEQKNFPIYIQSVLNSRLLSVN